MVNKSFIVIILTIVVLGVIFYLLGNCSREGFQDKDEPVRYFADVDTGDDYDNDFMSTNITKIKNVDVDDGRLKMFKFDGSSSFLYLTRVKDPKANVTMKIELDPAGDETQTLIDTNNYTLEYTATSIKFRYGTGKNRRKDFDIPAIEDFSVIQTVVLNFNRIGGTVTIGFGPDDNMTTYTSDSNVSGSFNNNNRDNYIYFGKTERNNNYFKGFMGDIKVSNRRQFYVKEEEAPAPEPAPPAQTEAPAPGQTCPVKEVVKEEEKPEEFNTRKGNNIDYTNSFLQTKTTENQVMAFPGLNKNVRMFLFNEDSQFSISKINSRNLTLYFAVQFTQLDYDEDIVEGDNFSIKIENGNLVLTASGNKKAMAVKTRRPYFLVLFIDSQKSSITMRLDMFSETQVYIRQSNINKLKIGGNVDNNTHFTGRIGNLFIVPRSYTIQKVCDLSRLCQLIQESCSGYTDESKCNRSSNKDGKKCEFNVVCVPRINTAAARDKCAKYTTGVECNNDRSCMVDEEQSQCREVQPVPVIEDVSVPTYIAIPTTTTTQDLSRPPPRNCSFKAEGKTRESCVDRCSNEFRARQINEDCNPAVCRIICDKCTSPNCFWKSEESISQIKEPMVPVAPKIKAYSGDSQVKLLWVSPFSASDIQKYTCIIEGGDLKKETRIEFPVDTKCQLCEHIVGSLRNGLPYNMYVIASNKEGDSLPSNMVSVMPLKGKDLPDTGNKHNMDINQLDDSLQEYKRVVERGDYSTLKKMVNIDDTEDADYMELLDLLVSNKQNKHLVNKKMKFEIVG